VSGDKEVRIMAQDQQNPKVVESCLHYRELAEFFVYPYPGLPKKMGQVHEVLAAAYPAAASGLKEFTDVVSGLALIEFEELYTRSFDVQAVTTLGIGYVMFGDDYKRGELLVNLSREQREAGVDSGTELSDHLPNILHLLAVMQDPELREELVGRIVAPALRKMIREFNPNAVKRKNSVYKKHYKTLIESSEEYGTIYEKPLKALYAVLESDFEIGKYNDLKDAQASCFLGGIGTEMTLECQKRTCHGSTE
jgi:nitrate reductase assembly molybdenum cofactor insertion protein NarJ